MKFFKFFEKLLCGTLLIFGMKLQQHKISKLTEMIFLGKILFRCFQAKRDPNLVCPK